MLNRTTKHQPTEPETPSQTKNSAQTANRKPELHRKEISSAQRTSPLLSAQPKNTLIRQPCQYDTETHQKTGA
jgi:hypothetical protein